MFTSIPSSLIQVGKALKKEIFSLLKINLDDHEERISTIELTSGASFYVFNGDVDLKYFDIENNDFFYFKAPITFNVTSFQVQLFDKEGVDDGILSVDVQKSVDTNNDNFASILESEAEADFSTDADYSVHSGSIDGSLNTVEINQILRIVVTSKPSDYFGKVLVRIGAI
jgi:hypothetical protein